MSIYSAYCKLCSRQFNITSMGKYALKSHMNGKTHQIHTKEQGNPIHNFFNTTLPTLSDSSDSSSLPIPCSSTVPTSDTGNDACATPASSSSANHQNQSSLHHLSTLSKKVADAEILWAL